METIASRVTFARESNGWNQTELANRVGCKPQAIQQIESGQTKRSRYMPAIAEATGFQYQWLQNGIGPMRQNGLTSNVAVGPRIQGKLPLLSWVQAGEWKSIVEQIWREGDHDIPMVEVTKTGGAYSFCLRVEGDSMVGGDGKYSFPEGIIIQVDPDIPAQNKSFVIARLCETNEATFKQLIIDGGRKYLKPLNPRYPFTECDGNIEIVGVVFHAIMDIPY